MELRRVTMIAAVAAVVSIAVASAGQAASGTEITTCGQEVQTNAYLNHDLDCSGTNTNGVVVGAGGITIDLKGHTIRGDRSGGFHGIDDNGYWPVTIRNGVVVDFAVGVYLASANRVTISRFVASGNLFDGIFVNGNWARILSTTASGNSGRGIFVLGDAARIQSTSASGNGSTGIFVDGAAAGIQSTSAFGNDDVGIFVLGDGASVRTSSVAGNGSYGIAVNGDASTITGNRANANGFSGGSSDDNGPGILATGTTTGKNVARGNDDASECNPLSLCVAPVAKAGKGTQITTCGQTVTTDAYLTGDLSCPGSDGIVVGADGITVDLRGFALRGDRTSGTEGVRDEIYDGTTVENGVVRDFDYGVGVSTDGTIRIANLIVSGNGLAGIDVLDGSWSMKSSTVAGNDLDGIDVNSLDSTTIQSSVVAGNGFNGLWIFADTASVRTSNVSGNGNEGLHFAGNVATVQSSVVSGNGVSGIAAFVSYKAPVITGNRAEGNGFAGGSSDSVGLGIVVDSAMPPLGTNVVRGNDDADECDPMSLC